MRDKLLHCYIARLLDCYIEKIQKKSKYRGFTLVEILLYMGLLAILLVVLTEILVSILAVKIESEATSSVEQDSRFILSRMVYDISRATDISFPPQIGQTRSNLKMTVGGFLYEYAENGGNLQLINDLGTNNLNSSETTISNPSFQRIANTAVPDTKDTIKIQFTITSKTTRSQGPETKTFTTTVGRR